MKIFYVGWNDIVFRDIGITFVFRTGYDSYIPKIFRFFNGLDTPDAAIQISCSFIFIQKIHRYLKKLSRSTTMQKKNLLVSIQFHEFTQELPGFIKYGFK